MYECPNTTRLQYTALKFGRIITNWVSNKVSNKVWANELWRRIIVIPTKGSLK